MFVCHLTGAFSVVFDSCFEGIFLFQYFSLSFRLGSETHCCLICTIIQVRDKLGLSNLKFLNKKVLESTTFLELDLILANSFNCLVRCQRGFK